MPCYKTTMQRVIMEYETKTHFVIRVLSGCHEIRDWINFQVKLCLQNEFLDQAGRSVIETLSTYMSSFSHFAIITPHNHSLCRIMEFAPWLTKTLCSSSRVKVNCPS